MWPLLSEFISNFTNNFSEVIPNNELFPTLYQTLSALSEGYYQILHFSKQKTGVSLIESQYLPGLLMSCPGLLHVKF